MNPRSHPSQPPEAGAPADAPFRPGRWIFAIAVFVLVAFAAGLLPRLRQRAAVRETTRELSVPTVTVVSPKWLLAGPPIALPAELRAETEAVVSARATGYVRRWHAELGASVTNGQLLAELDTPELDQDLAHARSQQRESEATEALARTTADRWKEMFRVAAVSRQETDEKAADLLLKTAQLESARSNVRRLEELAGFARITAPFDGIITQRRLDIGQLVNPAAGTELYRIANVRTLRAFVRIPQTLSAQVVLGQAAEISFQEHPGKTYPAHVVRTARALDPASRTLLTELEMANPEARLLAGGYAQVRFPEIRPQAQLTIPANTLLFRAEGPQVALVSPDGRVSLRGLTLGRDHGAAVEIPTGLGTNDLLVLNPSDALVDGAQVRLATTVKP
jgi:RND family efflux transporter MFP subunit